MGSTTKVIPVGQTKSRGVQHVDRACHVVLQTSVQNLHAHHAYFINSLNIQVSLAGRSVALRKAAFGTKCLSSKRLCYFCLTFVPLIS